MERLQAWLATAKKPEPDPITELSLQPKYGSAVFFHERAPYAIILFNKGEPDLVAMFMQRGEDGVIRYKAAFLYDEFMEYTKAFKPELTKIEDAVVREGSLSVDIAASVVSMPEDIKKIRSFVDRKRMTFVTQSVHRFATSTKDASVFKKLPPRSLVVMPASERDLWMESSYVSTPNRTCFLAYTLAVIKENRIAPCLPLSTPLSVAAYSHQDGDIANVYLTERTVYAFGKMLDDASKSNTVLFELLYTLWYIHTDFKSMICNVSSSANFTCIAKEAPENKYNVYRIDGAVYAFPASNVRMLIESFYESMVMRDSIILQGQKPDSYTQIKKIQMLLKSHMDYDLKIIDVYHELHKNDNWVDLYQMIFAVDYLDACELFDTKIAREIEGLCKTFIKGMLELMDSGKRPKYTFNTLWSAILDKFSEYRFEALATKRLEKYEVSEVYTYKELFNFCPQMSCFENPRFEE